MKKIFLPLIPEIRYIIDLMSPVRRNGALKCRDVYVQVATSLAESGRYKESLSTLKAMWRIR